MKRMRIAAMLSLFAIAMAASPPIAGAARVGIQVTVFRNGSLVGTALGGVVGGLPTLIVTASPGDTLRFEVALSQTATFQSYATNIRTDDPTEINFVNGSAVELSGKGFTGGGNPNTNLNDGSPGVGAGNIPGSGGTVTSQVIYRLDAIVQPGVVTDLSSDFRVTLQNIGSNTVNTLAREAAVRVDAQNPEPPSLLLLGMGLIPLVGSFSNKRG